MRAQAAACLSALCASAGTQHAARDGGCRARGAVPACMAGPTTPFPDVPHRHRDFHRGTHREAYNPEHAVPQKPGGQRMAEGAGGCGAGSKQESAPGAPRAGRVRHHSRLRRGTPARAHCARVRRTRGAGGCCACRRASDGPNQISHARLAGAASLLGSHVPGPLVLPAPVSLQRARACERTLPAAAENITGYRRKTLSDASSRQSAPITA